MKKRLLLCLFLLALPADLKETTELRSYAHPVQEQEDTGITDEKEEGIPIKDEIAPVVHTECPAADWEKEGRKYYGGNDGETEQLTLVFTEETYTEITGKPELTILKDGQRMEQETTGDWIYWDQEAGGRVSAHVMLPYEDGREICYQVEAVWQDDAGNPLTAAEGSFGKIEEKDKGVFVTGNMILDARSPELLDFAVEGNCVQTAEWGGERIPLFNDEEREDIRFTFIIDDGEEEWNGEELRLQIISLTDGDVITELRGDSEAVIWRHEGRSHQAEFVFDGEEGTEDVYQLQLSYCDRTGHVLRDGRTETEEDMISAAVREDSGLCVTSPFALDHAAPTIQIDWPEAVRVVKDGKDCDSAEGYTVDDIFYYNSDVMAEIVLCDTSVFDSASQEGKELSVPRNFCLWILKKSEKEEGEGTDGSFQMKDVSEQIRWSRTGDGEWRGVFPVPEEGTYRLQAAYQDLAGNQAGPDERGVIPLYGGSGDGRLESPLFVLDRTAPAVSLSYTEEPVQVYRERKYFNTAVKLCIVVKEKNFCVQEFKKTLQKFSASDSTGKDEKENTELAFFLDTMEMNEISPDVWKVELPLSTDANYSIPVLFEDLAGNQSRADTGTAVSLTVDRQAPSELMFTYSESLSAPYLPSGWIFAREKLELRAAVRDGTSGIRKIRFIMEDENGEEFIREQSFEPCDAQTAELSLPLEKADFKGSLRTEVYDWAGNCRTESRNYAVESQKQHKNSVTGQIVTLTEPSRTVNGISYYNTDIIFRIAVEDNYSGIREVRYSGGNTLSGAYSYAEEADRKENTEEGQEIEREFSKELILDAEENNENNIPVRVSFTDNAGYMEELQEIYHIDRTVPEISVKYDVNQPVNGHYFHQPRTAVVTIRERNFDEKDVRFHITNSEGTMPEISGWSSTGSGDDTLHVCTVSFKADGDYSFTVEFQDLAGNQAAYDRTDEFTIDQTSPELTVFWEPAEGKNDIYYAESRTAVIEILEHNFDEEKIDVTVRKQNGNKETVGEKGSVPVFLSEWKQEGDRHTARLTFSEDGIYALEVTGEDLAGNRMNHYESEPFVIDRTPPEISISDLENRSANNKEVSPRICYTDANCDMDSEVISLTGYRNGETVWEGERTRIPEGMELKFNDLAYTQEMDDMYMLKVSVQDLAGNRSTAQISFSVNRFGSVYTFDESTERLAGENGTYFTKEAQQLVIRETNVDSLEFQKILCSHDGRIRTLREGKDYTVKESGGFPGWKQYTYTVSKENFEKEGAYVLTVYSEDRAGNASDTGVKEKRIEFAVDRTAPVVLISGAEQGGRYREHTRELTLDIQDNLCLETVTVILNGETTEYSAQEIEDRKGRITLRIQGKNYWQELSVTACDAAGNAAEEIKLRLLVTPNLLVQLVTDRTLCYSIAAGLMLLTAGIIGVLQAGERWKKDS